MLYRAAWLAQKVVDAYFMLRPRPLPSHGALRDCRLVSHRGEHDNRRIRENTLAAFDAAAQAGVWGIEFDVRWSRDLCPLVVHDPNARRVFDLDVDIHALDADELRRRLPEIPRLEEVVAAHGGRLHLMIELKPDDLGQAEAKAERLAAILTGLNARQDYHFLALDAESLGPAEFAGPGSCLLVAETDLAAQSRRVLEAGYGGLCGHYLLLGESYAERHRRQGQRIGIGFPASRYSFYRELNRDIDWIFTNRAAKLARIRARLLERLTGGKS
jgi:glycerophosphoryl diester phosphodiesterase